MTAPLLLLVAMLQETGHLNPSFKLMRALKERGHDVRYLAESALAPYIEAQGFSVLPFFPDLAREPVAQKGRLTVLRERRAITARFRAISERLLKQGGHAFGLRPRLALVDVTQTHLALWARSSGIPLLLLNTSLPQTKAPGVAPLRSGLPFGTGLLSRARSELAWRSFLTKRRISAELAGALQMCPPYELSRRLSARFGVSDEELDCQTVYMPQLKHVPELVLCPPMLDFPRPAEPARHYVESLDLKRTEPEFPWERVPAQRPLVYCALGGQLYRARETPTFLRRVVRAFAARPDLSLVLATGQHITPEQLRPYPSHVIVVQRAPQLALLARARLMITHGGLGSVKECVAHGVPMLVFPLDVDQPGNAARVVHHGIGLAGDVGKTRARTLLRMVDRVLTEPSFGERCARFQAELAHFEAQSQGADLVERYLAQHQMLKPHAADASH